MQPQIETEMFIFNAERCDTNFQTAFPQLNESVNFTQNQIISKCGNLLGEVKIWAAVCACLIKRYTLWLVS